MITLMNGVKSKEPFPVAYYDNVISEVEYAKLLASFPEDLSTDRLDSDRYNKFYMSDRHQREDFSEFTTKHPVWRELYNEFRENFKQMCFDAVGPIPGNFAKTWSNMEFSALPAEGGGLFPHPDNAKKIATAVFFMEPDWNPEWGGGFEVLRRPDGKEEVDLAPWDEVETVQVIDVKPRRMLFMQRTPISYHGVRPLHAPRPRRSLTLNLIARFEKNA